MGRLGNGGKDGSEIDVFESSFYHNPTQIGHCIHWDGYSDTWHRDSGAVVDTGVDLYDDYHVWGLLWTPTEYTFFLDGKPIACTNAGGVSQVAEYLRFTVEIRHTEYGPYGRSSASYQHQGKPGRIPDRLCARLSKHRFHRQPKNGGGFQTTATRKAGAEIK